MRQGSGSTDPAELVGRRVVVRRRLRDSEFAATDTLGTLESWTEGTLRVISDRDGQPVDIDESDVLALKAVPARGVTRRAVRDLDAATAEGWRALEIAWIGGWRLGAAGGFSGRANSCLPFGDPGMPLPDAVEAVERWYRDRNLTPAFLLAESFDQAIATYLDSRGWAAEDYAVVMTAPAEAVLQHVRPHLPAARFDVRPDDAWLSNYHLKGQPLPPVGVEILRNAEIVCFASLDEDGQRIAIGRGAVTDSPSGRRWLGVFAVEVAPAARRRGLGSHIVAELAGWGARHGAEGVYVQVLAWNTPALAAYRKLGFTEHHHYRYRRLRAPRPGG